MKTVHYYNYDPSTEPQEIANAPLCNFVLESKEEVAEVIEALIPDWAWVEELRFKRGCSLAGKCKRVVEDSLLLWW